jgi:hypothetical protein
MLASTLIQRAKLIVVDNADVILTGMGITGTVTTAILTGRASFKAAEIIEKEKLENEEHDSVSNPLTKTDKVKLTWRLYIPAAGVGTTTVASILLANRISAKRIAALAVASSISDRALQEYKTKVLEKIGDKQDRAIFDEIAQDRVAKNPVRAGEIILAGTGEVLCYDMLTGRYFQSTVEEIKRAENKINYELIHFMSASLSMFYDEIGLPATTYSDSVGWNLNTKMEVKFSTTMSSDGRPCIAIDFNPYPTAEYDTKAWDH